jgi:hypothetical protein
VKETVGEPSTRIPSNVFARSTTVRIVSGDWITSHVDNMLHVIGLCC